jgi:hypothetical protein
LGEFADNFGSLQETQNHIRGEKIMVCCLAVFIAFFPRLGTLLIWLARPAMFMAAFGGNYIWPILGIIFLPFTTLMYVILWSPGIGLTTWDWLWLVLAVVLDVMHWGQTAYSNRERIPGMSSTPSSPPPPAPPSTPTDTGSV